MLPAVSDVLLGSIQRVSWVFYPDLDHLPGNAIDVFGPFTFVKKLKTLPVSVFACLVHDLVVQKDDVDLKAAQCFAVEYDAYTRTSVAVGLGTQLRCPLAV